MGMTHEVTLCGPRTCRRLTALVSTGVREMAISRSVARSLGIRRTANPVATVELVPESGCGKTKQPVVIDDELSRRWGNETGVVIGWGYLTDRRAQVSMSPVGDHILGTRTAKLGWI